MRKKKKIVCEGKNAAEIEKSLTHPSFFLALLRALQRALYFQVLWSDSFASLTDVAEPGLHPLALCPATDEMPSALQRTQSNNSNNCSNDTETREYRAPLESSETSHATFFFYFFAQAAQSATRLPCFLPLLHFFIFSPLESRVRDPLEKASFIFVCMSM